MDFDFDCNNNSSSNNNKNISNYHLNNNSNNYGYIQSHDLIFNNEPINYSGNYDISNQEINESANIHSEYYQFYNSTSFNNNSNNITSNFNNNSNNIPSNFNNSNVFISNSNSSSSNSSSDNSTQLFYYLVDDFENTIESFTYNSNKNNNEDNNNNNNYSSSSNSSGNGYQLNYSASDSATTDGKNQPNNNSNVYNIKYENNDEEYNIPDNFCFYFNSNGNSGVGSITDNGNDSNGIDSNYGIAEANSPSYYSESESESEIDETDTNFNNYGLKSSDEEKKPLDTVFDDSDESLKVEFDEDQQEEEEEEEFNETDGAIDGSSGDRVSLFNFNIGARFQNHLLVGDETNQVYISKEFEASIKEASDSAYNISLQMSKFTNRYIKIIQGTQNKRNKIDSDILRKWLEKHIEHPYPTKQEKVVLANSIGCSIARLNTWFTNNRRRSNPKCILHQDNVEIIKKKGLDQLKKSRKSPSSSSSSSSTTNSTHLTTPTNPISTSTFSNVKKSTPPRQTRSRLNKCKESSSVNLGLVNSSCDTF